MTYYAVFKSRAQTLEFISVLRGNGVPVQAVNTPQEARVGCGISAKFDEAFLPRVKFFLGKKYYASFAGVLKKCQTGYHYL